MTTSTPFGLGALLLALLLTTACQDDTPIQPPKPAPAASSEAAPSSSPTSAAASSEAASSANAGVAHVDVAGAVKLIAEQPELEVLDVRTPREFAQVRIAGALNIDFKDDGFRDALDALDRDVHYLVHCRSGRRSTAALAAFKRLGFKRVTHLDGGMLAWQKAGQPVERDEE